jgi:hypothetical protein
MQSSIMSTLTIGSLISSVLNMGAYSNLLYCLNYSAAERNMYCTDCKLIYTEMFRLNIFYAHNDTILCTLTY